MQPIHYTGGRLDRVAANRRDAAWVAAALASSAAQAVLMRDDQNLVHGMGTREELPRVTRLPLAAVLERVPLNRLTSVLLGVDGDTPLFAIDLDGDAAEALAPLVADSEFADLRRTGALVPPEDAAIMAYARAILAWHRRARYCGTCGSPTESQDAGHKRRCTNANCGTEIFPRTDPVVIMLVTRPARDGQPERCLLGRHGRLPPGMYSLLAGFIEPGESPEEAVAREVHEEAGVRVSDIRYQATQPWPFPSSLMMGFRATASSDRISLDADELEDAAWFTAAEVAEFGEWEDQTAARRLPRRDSIARALLDAWVAESVIPKESPAGDD